ncbi:hypothetical protein PHMEG_0008998 [Phytophthora megakarya]|uniref:Uncharacterized protein n=1 Tax=Phytophthora megakarya TaxID=4795 RepID=A0A225WIN7_9STRA|nr:hypothetical protein PHMEG_0008998 [Phytophthora megakarya]
MIDHGVEMPITLANQQEISVPNARLKRHALVKPTNPDINWFEETVKPRVESEKKEVNKPKTPNKKRINPRIVNIPSSIALKIGGQRFAVAGSTINAGTRYFHHGFFSTITGETKCTTNKQFRRTLKKPERLDCLRRKSKRTLKKH